MNGSTVVNPIRFPTLKPGLSRRDAALVYAEAGIPVYPCEAGGKIPLIPRWQHHRVTTREQIDEWWPEGLAPEKYDNIGFSPGAIGLGVVDLDGEAGKQAWKRLGCVSDRTEIFTWVTSSGEPLQGAGRTRQGYIQPETRVHCSPRGGAHLFYAGEMPTTGWKEGNKRSLGQHIDTRGIGGNLILPPSRTAHGEYRVEHDRPIADAPAWIAKRLAPTAARVDGPSDVELDQPSNIRRFRDHIASELKKHGGVEEGSRNNSAHKLLAWALDCALSREMAFQVLSERGGWNDHCKPPMDLVELRETCEHGTRQNTGAPKARKSIAELFPQAVEESKAAAKKSALARVVSTTASKVGREIMQWMWRDHIPHEMLSLLAGDGDLGKSTILCDIIARVTTGNTWPDGSGRAPKGRVLFFNIEDHKKKTLIGRLEAAGADMDLVEIIERFRAEDGTEERISFKREDHRKILSELVAAHGDVALVVLDPISRYFGDDVNLFKENEVRDVLEPLAELAEKSRVAIIGNAHLGKGNRNVSNANMAVLNSVAIVNVPRVVLQVAETEDMYETRAVRVFGQTKRNVAEERDALRYIIEVFDFDTREVVPKGRQVADFGTRVKWVGPARTSIRDLRLERSNKPGPADEVCEEAIRFYREYLSKGPLPNDRVNQAARASGFSQRTLARARAKLKPQYFFENGVRMIALPEWQANVEATNDDSAAPDEPGTDW
jgi:hypothetical protein